jgi:hypothetical protein
MASPTRTAWPLALDLTEFLREAGYDELSVPKLDSCLSIGIRELERRTNWTPMLAEAAESTVLVDPDWTKTILIPPFLTVSAVKSGVTSSYAGDTVPATDYRLNAHELGGYVSISFPHGCPSVEPQSISITGRRGLLSTIPEDIYQAALCAAAIRWAGRSIDGPVGAGEEQVSGVRMRFDERLGGDNLRQWKHELDDVVERYARYGGF